MQLQMRLHPGVEAVKRSARWAAARAHREDQAQQMLTRIQAARLAFDPMRSREMRDDHGLRVVLASTLRSDSNAIDVGANTGAVLEAVLRVAPRGRHIAYEPIPELHERLAARFPGVEVRRAALSDTGGPAEFAHVLDAPAYSGLKQRTLPAGAGRVRKIQVHTERLDDALESDHAPSLIKIDVEGGELNVLRGAVQTLERHRPFVLFEHGAGGADAYQATPAEVFDLLSAAGMRIFDMDGDGPYSRIRFEETFTLPVWNFLATPD